MKLFLTAQEIADLQLPDMPGTKRNINIYADRQGWTSHSALVRPRLGREGGGGWEYHIDLLPMPARLEYIRRYFNLLPEEPAPVVPAGDTATRTEALVRDARAVILQRVTRFTGDTGLSVMSADRLYAELYNTGFAGTPAWVRGTVKQLSGRTLARWRSEAAAHGVDALASDPSKNRKGTGVLDLANDGRVREWMLALIIYQPHLSGFEVRRQCRAEFGDLLDVRGKAVSVPPVRAFQRVIAQLKAENTVLITKLTNPDQYRSTLAPAGVGTYRWVKEPNQLWMIDASPVDALCTDGRHSIYACIDLATRRLVITVSKTPRAAGVALLLRKAILAFGVPDKVKTDNGSDFVARDTERLFAYLGVATEQSPAYTPEDKGHIERAIGTFQRQVAPLLPGYIGHSVADRKAIESTKSFAQRLGEDPTETFGVALTAAQLQAHIDQWIALDYHQRPHAGLKGKTPALAATSSARAIKIVPERALDLLLMPVADGDGLRTTTKFGIRIDGFHYATPNILPGRAVFVRQDPLDLGRAFCFAEDGGEFLGEAICAELRGIHPETMLRVTRETHAGLLAAATKRVKDDMRAIGKRPLIEKALDVAKRDAPNVISLPVRTEEHQTPQIAAALAAMSPMPAASLSDNVSALHVQLLAENSAAAEAVNVTPIRQTLTPAQLYRRALELEARMKAGLVVAPDELLWLGGYRESAAYQTMKTMHEDFGDQALS